MGFIYEVWKKKISENLIQNYLSIEGLAYWILDDGSLNKSKGFMTLHTEGFLKSEVFQLSKELNEKFDLNTKPLVKHKKSIKNPNPIFYWILYIPKKDVAKLFQKTEFSHVFMQVPSLLYKMPKKCTH